MSKLKRIETKALLEKSLSKGRITSVTWTKKSGEETTRNIKRMVRKYYSNGKESTQKATTAHLPQYFVCADLTTGKYVNINLDTVKTINGKKIQG